MGLSIRENNGNENNCLAGVGIGMEVGLKLVGRGGGLGKLKAVPTVMPL